jgi:hypothetical protein
LHEHLGQSQILSLSIMDLTPEVVVAGLEITSNSVGAAGGCDPLMLRLIVALKFKRSKDQKIKSSQPSAAPTGLHLAGKDWSAVSPPSRAGSLLQ